MTVARALHALRIVGAIVALLYAIARAEPAKFSLTGGGWTT